MRLSTLLFPCFLFFSVATCSFFVWILFPVELANDVGLIALCESDKVLSAYVLSILSFASGSALVYYFDFLQVGLQKHQAVSLSSAVRWSKLLIVTGYAFTVLLYFLSLWQGNIELILNAARGFEKLPRYPGITSLVHASTAAAVLVGSIWVIRNNSLSERVSLTYLALAAFFLCLIRAVVGSERVAIYYPAVAVVCCWALQSRRVVSFSYVLFFVLFLLFVFFAFAGAEWFRSYGAKVEEHTMQDTLLSFSAKRLYLYYGTAVNTAGAFLMFSAEDGESEPLFMHTLNPLRQMIDALNGFESQSLARYLGSSGLYNPEFNNVWGIASPFTEGLLWGCAYWVGWGFVSTCLYRRSIQSCTDAFSLAMFGIVTAGIVDAARVNSLGTVHILLPIGMLWIGRRYFLV